ncbi:hypothetical protein ACJ73_04567 [Blastomyces percursus]|uniref:Uncharacterized protein n=1 Tax=Blastomyces percursus TaxID=1658174 RepID=A0A1J9Q5R7_9EURO|nr:hypothetical protein ACJ73_04567 [Blastomyces percursus]
MMKHHLHARPGPSMPAHADSGRLTPALKLNTKSPGGHIFKPFGLPNAHAGRPSLGEAQ